MSAPRGRVRGSGGRGTGRAGMPRGSSSRGGASPSTRSAATTPSSRGPSSATIASATRSSSKPSTATNSAPRTLTNMKITDWRDPTKQDQAMYRKKIEELFEKVKAEREKQRKIDIRTGRLADPDKPTSLAEAITPVGTCPHMCSEFERVQRIREDYVDGPERIRHPVSGLMVPWEPKMVKRFRRSAAGTDDQAPSDIRPPSVLSGTLDYLLDELVGGSAHLGDVHKYVWDRTRAIRNDFSIQQVTKVDDLKIAIECFERIVRFHIVSLHQLSRSDRGKAFDAHQEREQLDNTLLSLMYYYDDSRSKYQSPNEAEFRAYCVIFEIQDRRPDLEDRAQNWPKQILSHPRVQTAFKIYSAAGNTYDFQGPLRPLSKFPVAQNFYGRFWTLVGSAQASYLMACVAEIYFNYVRENALQTLWRAFKGPPKYKSEDMVLSDVCDALGFDNEEQTQKYCEEHGFTVGEREDGQAYLDLNSVSNVRDTNTGRPQRFSQTYVESKRYGRTLPAIVKGYNMARCRAEGLIREDAPTMTGNADNDDEQLFVSDEKTTHAEKAASSRADVPTSSATTVNPFAPAALNSNPFAPVASGLPNSFPSKLTPDSTSAPSLTPIGTTLGPKATSNPFGAMASNPIGNPFPPPSTSTTANPFVPISTATVTTPSNVPSTNAATSAATNTFGFPQAHVPFGSFPQPAPTKDAVNKIFGVEQVAHPAGATSNTAATASTAFASSANSATAGIKANKSSLFNQPNPFLGVDNAHHSTATPEALPAVSPSTSLPTESSTSEHQAAPGIPQPIVSTPFLPSKTAFDLMTQNNKSPDMQQTSSTPPFQPSIFTTATPPGSASATGVPHIPQTALTEPARPDTFSLKAAPGSEAPGLSSAFSGFKPMSSTSSKASPASSTFQPNTLPTPKTKQTLQDTQAGPAPITSTPLYKSSVDFAKPVEQPPVSNALGAFQPSQPKRKPSVHNLARNVMLGEGGILEQYIENFLQQMIPKAIRKVDREKERAKVAEARSYLLSRIYCRKWREIAWNRKLARQGRERRRNLAQSMRDLAKSSRSSVSRESDPMASLTAFRQTSQEQLSRSASPSIAHANKRHSLPNGASNNLSSDQTASRAMGPAATVHGATNGVKSHASNHKRSQTMGGSSNGANSSRGAKYNLATHASRTRMLTSEVLADESLLKKARRLASGRLDTTKTDYFRLKAMGVDPDTPLVPRVLKRPRVLDKEETDSRKSQRSTPPEASSIAQPPLQSSITSLPTTIPISKAVVRQEDNDDDDDLLRRAREAREAMAEDTKWMREFRETLSRSRSQSHDTPKAATSSRTTLRLERTGAHGLYERVKKSRETLSKGKEKKTESNDGFEIVESPKLGPSHRGAFVPSWNTGIASSNQFRALDDGMTDGGSGVGKGASADDAIEL